LSIGLEKSDEFSAQLATESRKIHNEGIKMSKEKEEELTPEEAMARMQELFSDQQRWSSLAVTIDEVATENKALIRDLSSYDPQVAVALIAGLMTVPKYQANCLRLELLATLAWRHCKGKKRANIGQAVRWFHMIGKSRGAYGEDPAEDVFSSLVIGTNADFRILEGLWESAGFYTQIVYDIVQTMPDNGHWAQIKKCVEAILMVSEIVCENANVSRYQLGEDAPQRALSSRHLPSRNVLIRRVSVSFEQLETLGIKPDDIAPFIVDPEWKDEEGDQRASQTELHFKPLAILDSVGLTVALPTCLSLAMREYVISEIVEHGLEDSFDRMLANRLSALLSDTPLLGGPRGAPVSWRKVGQHRISSFGFQFDEGHFISLHFFLPSICTHAEGGFAGIFEDDGSLTTEVQKDVLASMDRFEDEDGFQAGLTLVVGGGWGMGYATKHFDVKRDKWHFESTSIADLVRVSWMKDMKPAYFWRIQDGLLAVEEKGVKILNPNGFLNLIGWVRSNDGHFVPHAQLPPDPITPDRPLMLNPPINMLRDVRADADSGNDKHGVSDEAGRRHVVQRSSPDPFFEGKGTKKLYASMTDVRSGTLTSCYEGKVKLWLSISAPNISEQNVEYRLWEMANEWLHRIGTTLDQRFGNRLNSATIRTNLQFLDALPPDGTREKPVRSDLEKLCTVELSLEQLCATATFDAGFVDGFRVAENIAERVVVRAMLSGFLQLTLGDLSDGILDELENEVVPNDDARSFHVFQAQGFMDYVRQLLPDEVITIDEIDDGIAKLGLGWRVRKRSDGPKIFGQKECTAFLGSVVDCLISDIEQELQTLPRRSFLHLVVKNVEKANAEEDHWRRTSAAVLGLHGRSEETLQKYVHQTSMFAAAGIASRVLAEMGLCMCPVDGKTQPTTLALTRLISRTLLVVRLAGLSDAIRFHALKPELTLSALGDILFKNDFGENVVEPLLSRLLGDRFIQLAPKQKRNYQDPNVVPETKSKIDERFWSIWAVEMGFDLDQARNMIGRLEDLAVDKQTPLLELKKSEVMRAMVGDTVDEKAVEAFLKQFSLIPRARWDKVPKGFETKDIYPWRFGRRLSFVTRPILQVDEEADPLLLVPPYSLRKGFAYVFDGAHSGSLEQSFFQTPEMRDDWWGGANEGHQFAASVEDSLRNAGWKVEGNVALTKILNKKLDIDFGDVDVLAWREDRAEVLIIECKNLQSARNYSEIAAMLSEYQGETHNGKRDKLKRHLDRVDLLVENQVGLGRYIKKVEISAVSCLCCSGSVPMQYSKIEALEGTKVCLPDELLSIGDQKNG
jgi:hypothetical protein